MQGPRGAVPILAARTFVLVWAALIALTAATVAVAKGGLLSRYSVLGALGIASLKATLVLGWFMHLRYESRLLRTLVLVALAAVSGMLALTFSDVWFRR
jgi:cytochrome c oxidase subunit IV